MEENSTEWGKEREIKEWILLLMRHGGERHIDTRQIANASAIVGLISDLGLVTESEAKKYCP